MSKLPQSSEPLLTVFRRQRISRGSPLPIRFLQQLSTVLVNCSSAALAGECKKVQHRDQVMNIHVSKASTRHACTSKLWQLRSVDWNGCNAPPRVLVKGLD